MGFDIRARILARKVIFCYFFEQYFLVLSGQQENVKEEVEKVHAQIEGKTVENNQDISTLLTSTYYESVDEETAYLVQHVFASEKDEGELPEVDYIYIRHMAGMFRKYEPIVHKLVDTHVMTFKYDEMDVLDRVIFVLGYAERKEIDTPREVVLNEMVELGKRYGDEASPKLINGIAHKLLTKVEPSPEEQKKK